MFLSLLPIGASKTPENFSKIVFLLQEVEGLARLLRIVFCGSEDKEAQPVSTRSGKEGWSSILGHTVGRKG